MSEDEIIEHVKYSLLNPCFNNGNSTIINNEDLKGLLDLYQQEKEKNKELEIRLQEEINEVCKLKTELYGNSISKDKIKAKIDYYQKIDNAVGVKILERILEED